ncbi:unnamed protein product [Mytilus coruscus]|uniref:Uncharacterized protein n=1 Tax=Mytilus coruscus TaxID=42192 RepID=A0A6J8BN93_MYTCO|nr:unnamed protein product [Mytilus coruscus]
MHRRSLKLRKRMSDTNTDSDSEIAKAFKDIPSAQPPSITVIPINFDMDSWDNENDNEGETLIDNSVEKIDNLLSKRHHISTLVRDLRRFQNDELPVYAVLKDASFSPIFGSDQAKTFFNSATEEINKIWQETTKEIRSRNKDSSKTIVKLNERIRQLKEEWTEKYRRASYEPNRPFSAFIRFDPSAENSGFNNVIIFLKVIGVGGIGVNKRPLRVSLHLTSSTTTATIPNITRTTTTPDTTRTRTTTSTTSEEHPLFIEIRRSGRVIKPVIISGFDN